MEKRRSWRRCPHEYIRGIYGDEINQTPRGARLECIECGRLLDGPVNIATHYLADCGRYIRIHRRAS